MKMMHKVKIQTIIIVFQKHMRKMSVK